MTAEIAANTSGKPGTPGVLRFGEYRLDPVGRQLWRGQEPIHLARLPFNVLCHLIERRPALVTRDELREQFWTRMPGGDEALTRCMSTVRNALGDGADLPRCIETRHGVGYRFIADVQVEPAAAAAEATESADPAIPGSSARAASPGGGRALRYVAAAAAAGLLVAVGLVQWMRLEIERAVSSGTQAIAARETTRADPGELRRQFERMPRAKLLWVDDHPESNQFEIEAFSHAGLVVDTAISNADAAERVRGREYDLVISDIGRDAPEAQRAGLDLPRVLVPDRNRLPPIIYYVRRRSADRTYDGYPVIDRPSELFRMTSELLSARTGTPLKVTSQPPNS